MYLDFRSYLRNKNVAILFFFLKRRICSLNALVAGVTWFENHAILNNPKDMSAGLQITGWPAHDSSISSILFGPDETSIFSLGSDGKASTINLMLFMFVK